MRFTILGTADKRAFTEYVDKMYGGPPDDPKPDDAEAGLFADLAREILDGARADLRHTPLTLHLLIEDTE